MADEKLTLDLEVRGIAEALNRLGSVSGALETLGSGGGGLAAAGVGLAAASRLGRFATAAAVAATAVGALAGAAKRAADNLSAFGFAGQELGSSTGETALLRMLSRAVGISDFQGFAENLRGGISSGLGSAYAAQIGIGPQMDMGGRAANIGDIALRIIRDIRAAATEAEALERARNFGDVRLVRFRNISQDLFDELTKDAEQMSRTFTPEMIERGIRFNAQLERVTSKWDQFVTGLGLSFLPILERALDFMNQEMGPSVVAHGRAAEANTAAVNANTRATQELQSELRMTNGIYGGGARARSAIPAQFGPGAGFAVSRELRSHAIRLGSFAVSM